MKAREVVKEISVKKGITNAELAHRLGLTIAACWERIFAPRKPKDMSTKALVPTLRAMDYKLIAVPYDSKVPSGGYVID